MSEQIRYCLFDTPIGICGMAWTPAAICRFTFPGESEGAVRERLVKGIAGAVETEPEGFAREVRDRVLELLEMGKGDLSDIPVDFSGLSGLEVSVLNTIRKLPPGRTTTYGDIAQELGDISLSQAVGVALGRNPVPLIVPCHRVLAANGKIGGFSGGTGVPTKRRLLEIEGARTKRERMQPDLFD